MNKTINTIAAMLACLTLTGTCLAAPHGGHRAPAPAPMHHHEAPRHHHAPPRHHHAPPPHHHHTTVVHHHDGGGALAVGLGAAIIGGIVGAIIGN